MIKSHVLKKKNRKKRKRSRHMLKRQPRCKNQLMKLSIRPQMDSLFLLFLLLQKKNTPTILWLRLSRSWTKVNKNLNKQPLIKIKLLMKLWLLMRAKKTNRKSLMYNKLRTMISKNQKNLNIPIKYRLWLKTKKNQNLRLITKKIKGKVSLHLRLRLSKIKGKTNINLR